MVTQIVTHLSVATRPSKRNGLYRSPRLYLPTKLTDDSAFPFKEKEKVVVRVVGERVVVEKFNEEKRKPKMRK